MQKISIIIGFIIWTVISFRIVTGNITQDNDIITAFKSVNYIEETGDIEGFGKFGPTHMTQEEKEVMIKRLANNLGIDNTYIINNDTKNNIQTTTLTKKGKYADTTIKIITVSEDLGLYYEDTQYVSFSLIIKDNIDSVIDYQQLIYDIFNEEGIDGEVNINLTGTVEGSLNLTEKNTLCDRMLKVLKAKEVSSSRNSDLYTVYAYSENIEKYITVAGSKININIVEEYDEKADVTMLYLSTPLNNLDY